LQQPVLESRVRAHKYAIFISSINIIDKKNRQVFLSLYRLPTAIKRLNEIVNKFGFTDEAILINSLKIIEGLVPRAFRDQPPEKAMRIN